MADFECLWILRQGAQAWNVWRGLSGYVKVDLVQADLARMDLRGVNQEGFDVTGASIEGTLFTDAQRDEGVVKGLPPLEPDTKPLRKRLRTWMKNEDR